MKLKDRSLGFVVNFFLGVSWAVVIIGFISSFLYFYPDSLFVALVFSLIASLPGMIAVLFLEHIISSKENYYELKKQIRIIEEHLEKNKIIN